jgi:anti-sigma B factor antagonist
MIETKVNNGVVVVNINDSDRLTAAIAEDVKVELTNIVSDSGSNVMLNLSNIKFIDSTGIGVLISALKTARQNDKVFSLCAIQNDVLGLLKLMKLDNVFDIYADESAI